MARRAKPKVDLGLRVEPALRNKLERAAKTNDRSINAEINFRLNASFAEEAAFGGHAMKEMALRMFVAFNAAGAGAAYSHDLNGDWLESSDCYRAAMFGVLEALMLRNREAMLDLDSIGRECDRLKGALAQRFVNAASSKGGQK